MVDIQGGRAYGIKRDPFRMVEPTEVIQSSNDHFTRGLDPLGSRSAPVCTGSGLTIGSLADYYYSSNRREDDRF